MLGGVGVVVLLGLATVLLVGAAGVPAEPMLRLWQAVTHRRSDRGSEVPPEVPDRDPAE